MLDSTASSRLFKRKLQAGQVLSLLPVLDKPKFSEHDMQKM